MGHSQASKQQTHERVVELASQRFRELGLDGLSIANLMKEAGLTHGGFYKHFESREDLVTQAMEQALVSTHKPTDFRDLVTDYLSPEHCQSTATGCAVGALVNDVARSPEPVRSRYTQQLKSNLNGLSQLLPADNARVQAIVSLSAMVGALGLARAVNDAALSAEILQVVRDHLLQDVDSLTAI